MLLKSIILLLVILALCVITFFRDRLKNPRLLFLSFGIIYFAVLLWFTVFRLNENNQISNSFIPFASLWKLTQVRWYGWGEYIFRAISGNVLLFIPIGILIANEPKCKHPFLFSGVIGFFASLLIELIQYITASGSFEADDLIFNTWGAVIGCSVALVIIGRKTVCPKEKVRIVLPLIIFFGVMAAICFMLVLKEIIRYY